MWLKVWKIWSSGRNDSFIYYDSDDTKEERKRLAEAWAEDSSGGHSMGWTVYWEKVDKPAEEWLNKRIKSTKSTIVGWQRYLAALTNTE